MALIKCPECDTEVSDQAEKCPKCAFPISRKNDETVQTIEQTSKKLKAQLIFATIALIIGIIMIFSASAADSPFLLVFGSMVEFASFCWLIAIKISIWWNHK